MKSKPIPVLAALCLCFVLSSNLLSAQSHWVHPGSGGRLAYETTPKGDRIPDFSRAGYEGGGVTLPDVPVKQTVKPSGADDCAAIQSAIDAVSALPLAGKFRGAVELSPGAFHCGQTLTISASGVVLRGARSGEHSTTIEMAGPPHLAIRIAGHLEQKDLGVETTIPDAYVAAGTSVIHVADSTQFVPGDVVLISKPVTSAWVHFMGMDNLYRNGKPEHWITASRLDVRRRVVAVSGNTLTLEVPLMDSYDQRFFDGARAVVRKIAISGQLTQVGVEDLRFIAPKQSIALGQPEYSGMMIQDVADSWMRNLTFEETTNGIRINSGSERMTFLQCDIEQHVPITSSAKPADFACNGSQILFDRCTATGDSTFYIVTQDREQGPVVALYCRFLGNGRIEPHQRWSTGLLIDNCEVPGGGIDLMNRGEMGSGHGWAIGWSVVWNSSAQSLAMNTPPGSMIWSIGNRGDQINPPFPVFDGGPERAPLDPATIESAARPVQPKSLYLAQLKERLGAQAVNNIGY